MAGDYDPREVTSTSARFDRQIVWAVLSLIYAAMAGIILGFVSDPITGDSSTATQPQIWAVLTPILIFVLLDLPALVISLRTMRRAQQSSIPLAVTLISLLALIVNIWVIVRIIVVIFYVLFVNGTPGDTGGALRLRMCLLPADKELRE